MSDLTLQRLILAVVLLGGVSFLGDWHSPWGLPDPAMLAGGLLLAIVSNRRSAPPQSPPAAPPAPPVPPTATTSIAPPVAPPPRPSPAPPQLPPLNTAPNPKPRS
ncbi:MAG: hypothetical protein VKK80_12455 [Prochlorothrix sp.]|nr:hypothetical protein [Prochlorothrix sp.]